MSSFTPAEFKVLKALAEAGFTPDEIRALKGLAAGVMNAMGGGTGGSVTQASNAKLDSQYGNPQVRRDPKRWAGDTCVGLRYSECPIEFLEILADYLVWSAEQDKAKPDAKKHANGKFYWQFNLDDAALALGWARRKREGWQPRERPAPRRAPVSDMGASDDHGDAYEGSYGTDELPF